MEQKLLDQYSLRTLNPQSWAQDTLRSRTNLDINQSLDDENNNLLDLVNKDITQLNLNNIEDPLNPSITIPAHNIPDQNVAKYSIESKQFNSKQFLKLIHKEDTFRQLSESLNILDDSIAQKNEELKSLVEKEFLKFVRSKTSLDDVLAQFSSRGFNDNAEILKSLKAGINEANKEGALLVKPFISNKQKEIKLRQSIEFVEKKKFFFMLPKALKNSIAENDYDNFIHDYKKAKQLKADSSDNSSNKVIARIWENVESIVDTYKKELWNQLNKESTNNNDDFLKTIKKLIELETIDNPILEWIDYRSKSFISNFNEIFTKYHEKILNIQLNILSTINGSDYSSFKQVSSLNFKGNTAIVQLVDSTLITEMWLMINKLFDSINELIQNFIGFWNHVENLISGSYNLRLVSSYIDETSPFINFEKYEIDDTRKKGEAFILQIISKLIKFFNSTQDSLKNLQGINKDLTNGNKEGNIDDFGFLPPFTNSLSTLRYLPTISAKTLKVLSDLGQLSITDKTIIDLRELSNFITERVIGGICASWLNDCHNFYKLENWNRLEDGETEIPTLILNFESYIIDRLGNLLFEKLLISSNDSKNTVQIVKYPTKKILTGVEIQFLRSFDLLLESIIKKIIQENQDSGINKNVKNYHKLLTLFNIKRLTSNVIPQSIRTFDAVFNTKLQNQRLEIYSLLEKMELTIFDSFMNDQRKSLSKIIANGISKSDWSNTSQSQLRVSPYIYQVLNVLIQIHTNVLSVSTELIGKVFSSLFEHISAAFLKQFREQTIDNQKQLVLDLEFFKSIIGRSITEQGLKNIALVYANCDVNAKRIFGEIKTELDDAVLGSSIEKEVFDSTK